MGFPSTLILLLVCGVLLAFVSNSNQQTSIAGAGGICDYCNGGNGSPGVCPAVNQCSFEPNVCSDSRFLRLSEYASGKLFVYYTAWSQSTQGVWWHIGHLATVAGTQLPGTTRLYRYYDAGQNNKYSLVPLSDSGWTYVDHPLTAYGFVYNSRVPGTFELMQFTQNGRWRLALEHHRVPLEDKGWAYQNSLGYVHAPCPFFN